jgi:hypothetical protein
MSLIRSTARLAAFVVVLALAASSRAQGVPTAPGHDSFWKFQPFLDPGYFEPDFQFFAPAEVNDFGGEEKPNYGLYITFDRTYVNVSRPRDEFSFGSGTDGDFTWGNRMEVGYMHGDPHGWQAVLWHVNGPNELWANADAQVLQSNLTGDTSFPFLIPQAYDSLNQLKMSSFELNKVWRRPPFHNQVNFEPFVGYRYMNVRDFFQRQAVVEVSVVGDEFFALDTFRSIFENDMHGGQLGGRFFRQRGHWMLSADIRFFAMANFQKLRLIREQSFLPNPDENPANGVVDVIGPLPLPFPPLVSDGADVNRALANQHRTQFCWGGELRVEASYELTRDINLRFGGVFLDLGQGIGRGFLMRLNNQDIQMAGVTFGFTVNR